MKFKINKNELIKTLNNVLRGIDSNPILVSLKGVYIIVNKTEIIFITSDGNLSIKSIIKTNENIVVEETGEILIPCKLFLEAIKKQISEDITINNNDNILYITSKNSSITINLLNKTDYPHISFIDNGKKFEISNQELKKLYYDVNFAASDDDKRIIFNGINLSIKNNILRAVATNSYRLAIKKVILKNADDLDITIYSKNLRKFILNRSDNEIIKFIIDDQKINLNVGDTIIQSKLIDAEYPNVFNFIPEEFDYQLNIKSNIFHELIERAIIINNIQGNSIKMEINSKEKKIIISSKKEEIGTAEIKFNEIDWKGESLIINFDSKYMIDALKTYSEMVKILFNGPLKPIIIKSDSKPELTQLVLPQKTY